MQNDHNTPQVGFSYYGLALLDYLRGSHPDLADDIPEADAREAALILLPHARDVARGYELSDGFADTPQYEQLYTELTGTVQILLGDGVQ